MRCVFTSNLFVDARALSLSEIVCAVYSLFSDNKRRQDLIRRLYNVQLTSHEHRMEQWNAQTPYVHKYDNDDDDDDDDEK